MVKTKDVVVQDAAHVMLTYEGEPLSFLQVPGAREVGVEVHSLSKGFNMIGWRIGWVCGHQRLVRSLVGGQFWREFLGHIRGQVYAVEDAQHALIPGAAGGHDALASHIFH